MKIKNQNGEAYDLAPETKLEFTRSNPFFSEMGEQTIPVALPPTPRNIQLLKNPQNPSNRNRIAATTPAMIQAGTLAINAQQAVLSANSRTGIQTSFYVNTGALYALAKNTRLFDLFTEKRITFENIDEAINFATGLIPGSDPRFLIFPVITENYTINKMGQKTTAGFAQLDNRVETTETIDEKKIQVPPGFYISPFIKVKHLLSETLEAIGYELTPSFLDSEPFASMVFLNDTLDAITGLELRYIDIIPDITVAELFDTLRKFNMEIIADERTKSVQILHFDEMSNQPPAKSLSSKVSGHPSINYHHNYKRLTLESETIDLPELIHPLSIYIRQTGERHSTADISQPPASFIEAAERYPGAYLHKPTGNLLNQAFRGDKELIAKVGTLAASYNSGERITAESKKFIDLIPVMISQRKHSPGGIRDEVHIYTGPGRFLHSNITYSDNSTTEIADPTPLKAIFCFSYFDEAKGHRLGTTSNHNEQGVKLWNHSLQWNGADGIFERFWRSRDDLNRNALLEVEFDLLLSEVDKFGIKQTDKITIENQDYFIKELTYTPDEASIHRCRFLTTNQQQPTSHAPAADSYLGESRLKWALRSSQDFTPAPPQHAITQIKYQAEPTIIIPPPPRSISRPPIKHYQQSHPVEYGWIDSRSGEYTKEGDGVINTWLEAVTA